MNLRLQVLHEEAAHIQCGFEFVPDCCLHLAAEPAVLFVVFEHTRNALWQLVLKGEGVLARRNSAIKIAHYHLIFEEFILALMLFFEPNFPLVLRGPFVPYSFFFPLCLFMSSHLLHAGEYEGKVKQMNRCTVYNVYVQIGESYNCLTASTILHKRTRQALFFSPSHLPMLPLAPSIRLLHAYFSSSNCIGCRPRLSSTSLSSLSPSPPLYHHPPLFLPPAKLHYLLTFSTTDLQSRGDIT
mmetsp:Transcript_5817/g.13734  ORF Transcript_5817/g.13734 Transcript_5817/m.13734 type:complete len:241 (-) Transcript_5817:374-1096(-)